MEKDLFYPQDSIAALATPWGESALAVVRISGVDSLQLLDSMFQPASKADGSLQTANGHTVHRGMIYLSIEDGTREIIDDVLVALSNH